MSSTNDEVKEHVRALERGLNVLEAFDGGKTGLTLADVARRTKLSRATARRLLLTLERLGYVATDGHFFVLQPRVLTLSHAYLSSVAVTDILMPYMEQILEGVVHVSSSAAVLDDTKVVFICGVPAKGFVRTSMTVGLTFPAVLTSTGRAILAQLSPEEVDDILARSELHKLTPETTVDPDKLRTIINEARLNGYGTNDRGLDMTIKSVAVPIFNRDNQCVASISISCHNMERSIADLVEEFLPRLNLAAERLAPSLPRNPLRK